MQWDPLKSSITPWPKSINVQWDPLKSSITRWPKSINVQCDPLNMRNRNPTQFSILNIIQYLAVQCKHIFICVAFPIQNGTLEIFVWSRLNKKSISIVLKNEIFQLWFIYQSISGAEKKWRNYLNKKKHFLIKKNISQINVSRVFIFHSFMNLLTHLWPISKSKFNLKSALFT